MPQTATRPLDGYRIIDLTANVAGPLATQVLRDLGAEVIKIEPPTGDASRKITATAAGIEHVTPYFSPFNRGKKSVRLSPRDPADAQSLRELLETADVLVQGMRPGALAKHGLGPEDVRAINPRLVYASISAYGGGSPLQDRPGIDMLLQAEAGCLSSQPPGDVPRLIPFQLIDGATGHVLAQAVLAALLHRERFGVVNSVEVAMYDVACSLQANYLTLAMAMPDELGPLSTAPEANGGRRAVAVEPSGVFRTGDGDIVLAAYVPAHWERFVELLGAADLAEDPRYADQAARSIHSVALRARVTELLQAHDADEWVRRFDAAGLMAARVSTWSEVVRSPVFEERGLRLTVSQGEHEVGVPRSPARYSEFDSSSSLTLPALGEHESLIREAGDRS
ncbi:crotonobetainyl-CoA:carnitine CoA-transferase CaiB-like acyl-CoA transferase [Microbacterium resistens]|uniref:Crotonobetainyl-CoA:carnitine CoA-transferase CaiB-like acyl-CoA transferase n=1 Tax=Microbacterium resistens TaxID=156977 RepID=A0ABU1SFK3_9MICO|nr:CoA transferase [Microbacterium resistens]MDR6868352.1 crotonobetainyl-CoA:carnitine CoA-transferase CaiB-like acyl-CoA transferase [Microbacterium resistens]